MTATHPRLYTAPRHAPELVRVPDIGFVMVDGQGNPSTAPDYRDAIQALYSISFTLKFTLRKKQGIDYRVSPLEGLWWAQDMGEFSVERMGDWSWTMMIAQPDAVSPDVFEAARAEVSKKKRLPALGKARLVRFEEGLSAQVLHVGPFSAEGPTIALLHAFIHDRGYSFDGRAQKHHEIYLSDPRRAAPERWKTILRQPVTAVGGETS